MTDNLGALPTLSPRSIPVRTAGTKLNSFIIELVKEYGLTSLEVLRILNEATTNEIRLLSKEDS